MEHFILYELAMLWIVASITVVAASMVFGGLLCVWCAFIGRRRAARMVSSCTRQLSHPWNRSGQACLLFAPSKIAYTIRPDWGHQSSSV